MTMLLKLSLNFRINIKTSIYYTFLNFCIAIFKFYNYFRKLI